MPKRKTLGMTVAVVEWFDASYQRGEVTADEFVPRVVLTTAGLLAREDADTVSVALDHYDKTDDWRYVQHIPKVNVVRIRRLEV